MTVNESFVVVEIFSEGRMIYKNCFRILNNYKIPKVINITYDYSLNMQTEIENIKQIRKNLGLTQSDLAKRAQVSQSLIAKIESGRLDPTYSNAKKIFQALTDMSKKTEAKAGEIMTKHIISLKPSDNIKDAIKIMKENNISQMPVIEHHKSIGLVSEAIILESILNNKGKKVREIMQDSPPVVSKNASVSVISQMLKFFPMVLVSDDGELKGVITKADLLDKVFR